jgi:Xaa-Pro aminopeptidase
MQPSVLSLRQQDAVISDVLKERFATVLPQAMEHAGIDMWIIVCQEDDYDPIYKSVIPMIPWSPILNMLVFYQEKPGDIVKRFNLSRVNTRDFYESRFTGFKGVGEEWLLLAGLIEDTKPEKIGLNIGSVNWAAGGLTYNLYNQLLKSIPKKYENKIVSAEKACEKWGMMLTKKEIILHEHAVMLSKDIIQKCYSRGYVTPELTTAEDLCWAYWQQVKDLGLEISFQPSFSVERPGVGRLGKQTVIKKGDFIVNDVGLTYLRLNTDHQQWAYVGSCVPKEYNILYEQVKHLQSIFMDEFQIGLSGNEMLNNILSRAIREGIRKPRVYSHSLGLFLHEPGPLIGLPWEQKDTGGRGDVVLDYNSIFTMELSITDSVKGQEIIFNTEENVVFTQHGCKPQFKLQEDFILI